MLVTHVRSTSGRLWRRHLVEALKQPQCRVFVVQGPAGSGKTTLVQDVVAELEGHIAWCTVGAEVLDGLLQLFPNQPAVGRLRQAWSDGDVVELCSATTALLATLQRTVTLVIDDVHLVIRDPVAAAFLGHLLGHPRLKMYLTTRSPLPFGLARLALQHRTTVITPSQLAFSEDEIHLLFGTAWGCPINREVSRHLAVCTGGWIAGLVLLHPHWQAGQFPSVDVLVREPLVYDYLKREMLDTISPGLGRFLMETSVLDGFDLATACFVTDETGPGSVQFLKTGRDIGLFLVQNGSARWACVPLLLAFLRYCLLLEVGPEGVRDRHRRVAGWIADADPARAIVHYLLAESWGEATLVLEMRGFELLDRGCTDEVENWLATFPCGWVFRANPLLLLQASVAQRQGRWRQAVLTYETLLERTREGTDRGFYHQVVERTVRCLIQSDDPMAARRLMEGAAGAGADIRMWLGSALIRLGQDVSAAYEMLEDGYKRCQASLDPSLMEALYIGYGFVYHLARGRFQAGLALLDNGTRLFQGLGNSYMVFHLLMNQALLQCAAGNPRAAASHLAEADEYRARASNAFVAAATDAVHAWVALEENDLESAGRYLLCLDNKEIPGQIRPWHLCTLIRWHLAQLNLVEAVRLGDVLQALVQRDRGVFASECWLVLASLLSAQGNLLEARRCAQTALDIAEQGGFSFWEMKAHARLAGLCMQTGPQARAEALRELATSLELSWQQGYWDFWRLEAARPFQQWLEAEIPGPVGPHSLKRVRCELAAIEHPAVQKEMQASGGSAGPTVGCRVELAIQPSAVRLGKKQVEALTYVAAGCSRAEIAQRLCLSVSAIDWRLSRVYELMGIENGPQAVLKGISDGTVCYQDHEGRTLGRDEWMERFGGQEFMVEVTGTKNGGARGYVRPQPSSRPPS